MTTSSFKVVITGGGTGGHIYPALAIAEQLVNDSDVTDLLYIGKRNSMEQDVIPAHHIAFQGISFSGMPRTLTWRFIPWGIQLIQSILEAYRLLNDFQPHMVFGTGGYVSAPVLMSAKLLGIPYIVHEPDAHPGLVNRLMGRWATAATGAFQEAQALIKTRDFNVTGNPIRGKIGHLTKADALACLGNPVVGWHADDPVLVVTGGSQGSRTLNQAVIEALPELINRLGLRVIHQTGQGLYDETRVALQQNGFEAHPSLWVQPFFTDMAAVWGASDVALCRSGSLTLSELYICGLPSVLVPFPYAAADHQRKNAQASEQAGASVMIPDSDCTADRLVKTLEKLLSAPKDPERLNRMREASRSLAHPDATQAIVSLIKAMRKKK